jgi:nitroreductase
MSDTTSTRDRIAFLRGLRAVRHFLPDPVPQEVVDDLLTVARWSGSASNRQPWEVILVRDRDVLRRLSELDGYAKHLAGAPLGVVLVMTGEAGREDHESYDEGRLSERLMLAADAHGVGSCIGWLIEGGREQARQLLGVPEGRKVRTILSLGYPDKVARAARQRPEQPRKALDTIVRTID